MRRVCLWLAAVMATYSAVYGVARLRQLITPGLEEHSVLEIGNVVVMHAVMVLLPILVFHSLWSTNRDQPNGLRMLGVTLAVMVFGLFGAAGLTVGGTAIIESSVKWWKSFDGLQVTRLIFYLTGFASALYVSIRVIQINDARPARFRSIFPPWLIATLLIFPVIQLLLGQQATAYAERLELILFGIIMFCLAWRAIRMLRGIADAPSSNCSIGERIDIPVDLEDPNHDPNRR